MAQNRIGGIINVKINGILHRAKGSWSYNLGRPKREAVVGADAVHGFKETPQQAFVEGAITDSPELDLQALVEAREANVTLELANGKVVILEKAWYAGEGTVTTEEGEIEVRFEAAAGEEAR